MSRMNKSASITGRPRDRKPDTHGDAVAQAHAEGLAAYAGVCPDGSPALFSSRQRAAARRAKAMAEAAKHTPLPWRAGNDVAGRTVIWSSKSPVAYTSTVDEYEVVHPCTKKYMSNTEFIIRAVNSHYDLLAACREAVEHVEDEAVAHRLMAAIAKATA